MNKTKPVIISDQKLRLMLENAHDGFVIHDSKGNILDVNRVGYERLGYTREEILSLSMFDIEISDDRSTLIYKIWPSLNDGDSIFKQGVHKRKDGSEFPVDVTITCIKEKNESLFLALARDATETENLKAHLKTLAMTDELTSVFNRRAFMDSLKKELSKSSRAESQLSLLAIDLDHFKNINDSYGHSAGDAVLKHFTRLVEETIRAGDVLGRLGGEEFAVILPNTNIDIAFVMAERLRSTIESTSAVYKEHFIKFTISIGISTNFGQTMVLDMMLDDADVAMYKAKHRGRNCIVKCDDNLST